MRAGNWLNAMKQATNQTELQKLLGATALYALTSWSVRLFFGEATIFFLASGIALAAVLIGGNRYAGAVFVGALLANAFIGVDHGVNLAFALGSCLSAWAGAYWIRRSGRFNWSLTSLQDIRRLFVWGALAGSGVSAIVGASSLFFAGAVRADQYPATLLHWWMGDALGVVLMTTPILLWWPVLRTPENWSTWWSASRPSARQIAEPTLLLLLTTVFAGLVFLDWTHSLLPPDWHLAVDQVFRGYWMFLFVAWAAVRHDQKGAALVLLLVSAMAVAGVDQGTGFFSKSEGFSQLISYWFFTMVLSLVGMTMATYAAANKWTAKALGYANVGLNQELTNTQVALDRHAIVATTDTQGLILSVNDRFCAASGYTRDELLGQDHSILNSGIHPKGFFKDMYRSIEAGRHWQADVCSRAKDGNLFWMQTTVMPFMDDAGKPERYIAIRYDITANKAVEAELISKRVEAEQANRIKSDFLANMSHEIRTPMNGIIGMTSLALDSQNETERTEFMGFVKSSAESLLVIINDILDFSKIEAGKLSIEQVAFDLRLTLTHLFNPLGSGAKDKGLQFNCDIAPDVPPCVLGDPTRLRQVLLNLVGNAIKFTQKGRVDCSVSVVDRTASTVTLRFAVCDTGIGIAADKLSTVFEAFAQADTSTTRRFGGTGLGLSISTRLVELMRGHLDVRSEMGKGSVFSFTLILDIAELPAPNPADYAVADRSTGKVSLRILLVEDNPINQMLAMRLLEKWGHCTTLAANGQIAIDLLAKGARFELVLMDMQMPVMGGIEATRQLRLLEAQEGWLPLPVIAMTANAMESDRKACMEAGMDDFLSKPINHAALAAVLATFDGERT